MTARTVWSLERHCRNPACRWWTVARGGQPVTVHANYDHAWEHVMRAGGVRR